MGKQRSHKREDRVINMGRLWQKAVVVNNSQIADKIFRLGLNTEISGLVSPGQFVMLQPLAAESLLPRPFSVYSADGNSLIEIVYQVRGQNTSRYTELKPGDCLMILGPCGKPVVINEKFDFLILIGGGCGLASLHSLAKFGHQECRRLKVVAGFRNQKTIFGVLDFSNMGIEPTIATEDGSVGIKGTAIDAFKFVFLELTHNLGRNYNPKRILIFTCGPRPMEKEVATFALSQRITCLVFLEEMMGCGLGSCLGCAVQTKYGTKHICLDGPIFPSEEVVW